MNGNDLMRAMNGIDGRYLAEVQTESKKKPHFRKSVTTAAMILLAATLTTVTAAAGWHLLHPETVEHYMKSGSVQKMETAGMVLNQTVENDYFRLTAESIVWDGKMGRIFTHSNPKQMQLMRKFWKLKLDMSSVKQAKPLLSINGECFQQHCTIQIQNKK